jgi:hypothetical protein
MTDNNYTGPMSTAFELQRDAVKQGQEAFERSLDFQRRMNRAMLDGMENQEETQRTGVEFARDGIHAYLDAVETMTAPGMGSRGVREMRRSVDDGFDNLLDAHEEAFEAAEEGMERSVDEYDEFSEAYLDALEAQVEALLEAHEDVQQRTVSTMEESFEQYEQFQSEMEGQADEMNEAFERQAEQFRETFERQLDQYREQVDRMQQQVDELQRRTEAEK